jgi:imidazolonepropionase-like amidohydrolase
VLVRVDLGCRVISKEQSTLVGKVLNEMSRLLDSRPFLSRLRLSSLTPHFGLLAAMLLALCASGWSQSLAIQNVTVIDATGAAARPNMTVVVDRDHIVFVGPTKKAHIPKNAVVVDGAGKFLIPGLWDMHVHGASDERAQWSHLLFLANGVVGVRDMFGPSDAHAWRAAQASKEDRSPAIYLGSPVVDGPNPRWPRSIVVTDEEQAREVVDQQQQRGADFIKVYDKLPRSAYFALADEAKKRGIPFEGHVPESLTAEEASDAGQKSIEHLTRVAISCSKDESAIAVELRRQEDLFRAPDATMAQKIEIGQRIMDLHTHVVETFDDAAAQALLARFVKNGTWQCPTLTLLRAEIEQPLPADDLRLKYLSKADRTRFEAGYFKNFPPGPHAAMLKLQKLEFDESLKIVGLMYRAGVPILAGTDAMNPNCFPGFSLHDEMALLVDAGLPPLAALQTATRNAAQFMGQLDRRGTIETGKIADLVLLDKDPLADIHNTRAIQAIVLGGKLYPRVALDAMLARAETLASRTDDSFAGR